MHPVDSGLPTHHEGGSRVGPRAVPPKPGEGRTGDGDAVEERRSEDADAGRGEDEDPEDEKGALGKARRGQGELPLAAGGLRTGKDCTYCT